MVTRVPRLGGDLWRDLKHAVHARRLKNISELEIFFQHIWGKIPKAKNETLSWLQEAFASCYNCLTGFPRAFFLFTNNFETESHLALKFEEMRQRSSEVRFASVGSIHRKGIFDRARPALCSPLDGCPSLHGAN